MIKSVLPRRVRKEVWLEPSGLEPLQELELEEKKKHPSLIFKKIQSKGRRALFVLEDQNSGLSPML